MRELSLIILDIAENSVSAGAKNVEIELFEHGALTELKITDDGAGMNKEILELVRKGEYSSKTGENFGSGIKLLKSEAESVTLNSEEGKGTCVKAVFKKRKVIFSEKSLALTLGDLIFCHGDAEFSFVHYSALFRAEINSRRLKREAGNARQNGKTVFSWISRELNLQYGEQK